MPPSESSAPRPTLGSTVLSSSHEAPSRGRARGGRAGSPRGRARSSSTTDSRAACRSIRAGAADRRKRVHQHSRGRAAAGHAAAAARRPDARASRQQLRRAGLPVRARSVPAAGTRVCRARRVSAGLGTHECGQDRGGAVRRRALAQARPARGVHLADQGALQPEVPRAAGPV